MQKDLLYLACLVGLIWAQNVGIGTSMPAERLHVYDGRLRVSHNNSSTNYATSLGGLQIQNLNATVGAVNGLVFQNAGGFYIGGIAGLPLGDPTINNGGHLAFWTKVANGSGLGERMRITDIGRVGIGVPDPITRLEVYDNDPGDVSVGGSITLSANGGGGRITAIDFRPWRSRPGGPAASIRGIDDADFSAHLAFFTAPPGGGGNPPLAERMRITPSGNVGIGTAAPSARLHVAGGDARILCGPGPYSGDAITYGGYITGWSVSDGHRLLPNPGDGGSSVGWGYVGLSDDQDWWYLYADNIINTSRRDKKRNLTPIEGPAMEHVLRDLRALKPYFYKYKSELDELVPGYETRYRANMHMGILVDEAPDYLKDQAFAGIDIYALATMGVVGVKYLLQEVDKLKAQLQHATLSGEINMETSEVRVRFSSSLPGKPTHISITPLGENSGYYLKDITEEGFTIVASKPFRFGWQATLPVSWADNIRRGSLAELSPTLLSQLIVDSSKKEAIQAYWRAEAEKSRQSYQAWLTKLEKENPDLYRQISEENEKARRLMEIAAQVNK